MKFLTDQDLLTTIELENLNEITNSSIIVKNECEDRSLETVKEFLRGRYDIEYELRSYTAATTGFTDLTRYNIDDTILVYSSTSGSFKLDDRNFSLKSITLDLMKYELFQRVAPRQISSIIVDRYDRAIQKLTDINKGMLTMSLKSLTEADDQNYQPFRYGQTDPKFKW
jgi:hypothetical protein